ncbi:hypothetical protein CYMTET_19101 [Cymbomonas tetramitiformis]|uniref:Uncharacterized protein n=1 Tax=Cymbomonas tetramitiformis TaxID=36881 RepID=A0AAE0L5A9_9CHLO|nr:hypothetical protein CYMTET_19101 [Cymbomonas tetramitiformis]
MPPLALKEAGPGGGWLRGAQQREVRQQESLSAMPPRHPACVLPAKPQPTSGDPGRWEDDDARRSGTAALDPAPTSTATSIADGFLSNPWMAMFDREEAANEIALNSLGLADRLMPPSAPAWPPLRELPEESKTNTGPRNAAPLPDCWDRPGQQSSEADTVGEQHGDGMASSGSYPMHAFPVAARLHSNHQDDSTATSDSFTADGGWDFDEILRDR